MMRPIFLFIAILVAATSTVSASIFLPGTTWGSCSLTSLGLSQQQQSSSSSSNDATFHRQRSLNRALSQQKSRGISTDGKLHHPLAMAIPGNGLAEQVIVGGFGNFISIYNTVITARILLSWFPQAQGVPLLQPVFAITDPYLNLFRGIIPPIFGLDLSPILAFVTLNLLQSSAASLGAEIPEDLQEKLNMQKNKGKKGMFGVAMKKGKSQVMMLKDV